MAVELDGPVEQIGIEDRRDVEGEVFVSCFLRVGGEPETVEGHELSVAVSGLIHQNRALTEGFQAVLAVPQGPDPGFVHGLLAVIVSMQQGIRGAHSGLNGIAALQQQPLGDRGPGLPGKTVQLEAPEGLAVVGQHADGLKPAGDELLLRTLPEGVDGVDRPGAGGGVPMVAGDEAAFPQAQALRQLLAAVLHVRVPEGALRFGLGEPADKIHLDVGFYGVIAVEEHQDPPVGVDRQGALVRLAGTACRAHRSVPGILEAAIVPVVCRDSDPGGCLVQPIDKCFFAVSKPGPAVQPALRQVDRQVPEIGGQVVFRSQAPGQGGVQVVEAGPAQTGPAVSHGQDGQLHGIGDDGVRPGPGDSGVAGRAGGGGVEPALQILPEEEAPHAQGDQHHGGGRRSGPGPVLPDQDRLLGLGQQIVAHVVQTV